MRVLLPLLLLLVSVPTWAQRQFDIEVIIFERDVNPEQINESWPNQLPAIAMDKVGEFDDQSYLETKGVTMLPASDYQLQAQEQALDEHAGFTVLFHKAWRQGDEGKLAAPVFHIRAGKDYSDKYNPNGSEKVASQTTTLETDGIKEVTVDKPLYELDGKLQVYVQHYLYAETTLDLKKPAVRDLHFQEAQTDSATDGEPEDKDSIVQIGHLEDISPTVTEEKFLKSYRMEQVRRIRSGETHYLDNPLLGMIIQIRRVPQAQE